MDGNLFRKKSMDRVTSPEQLTDYIKVSNPGVWMLLAAIIIFLVGICVWGAFGKLETKLPVAAVSENGATVCYVKEADIATVEKGMTVRCGDKEYTIADIGAAPIAVTADIGEYALHVGNIQSGEWVYIVSFDTELPDGVYRAEIIKNSVSPLSFVFN